MGVVAFITIYRPHHLYEQVRRDLRSARETSEFFKSPACREIVQRIVDDIIGDKTHTAAGRADANKPEQTHE